MLKSLQPQVVEGVRCHPQVQVEEEEDHHPRPKAGEAVHLHPLQAVAAVALHPVQAEEEEEPLLRQAEFSSFAQALSCGIPY